MAAKKVAKKVTKTAAGKAAPRVVRRAATVPAQAQPQGDAETALYEVLEPFKFRGARVKPPVLIEMTAAEAEPYQDAGVIGTEPSEAPSTTTDTSEAENAGQDAQGAGTTDGA